MVIWDNKYVRFTTFRRDGSKASTPVWIVPLGDGRAGFTTPSTSFKAKRLGSNPRVELAASDMKGNVADDATVVEGTATVVTGDEFERVSRLVKAKYGFSWRMIQVGARVMSWFGKDQASDSAVIIDLDA
ncbi:MAG: PPOX class F420-dependent oxidoreductase [Microthrixaceae bacterium]|nr:PPOX class F420-dependent oxidoreductase [Microthrixaceae bacterium]